MTRLLVCGSRSIRSQAVVSNGIDEALRGWSLLTPDIECLVSGGAKGVDQLAELWAGPAGVRVERFVPDWEGQGRRAGIERNLAMLDFIGQSENPRVVAIWDGTSRGTKHSLDEARRRGFAVHLLTWTPLPVVRGAFGKIRISKP